MKREPLRDMDKIKQEKMEQPNSTVDRLRFALTDIPPPPLLLGAALQHVLMVLSSCLATSFIVSDVLCVASDDPLRTKLFSSTLFMCGVCSILQTLFGIRLPIFQGPSSSFLPALLAIQKNSDWMCPAPPSGHTELFPLPADNMTFLSSNTTERISSGMAVEEKLQKLSGSLMAASLFEILVGGTGIIGILLRFIGPITVAPTISLIGISIYKIPILYSKSSWEIAFSGALLILILTMYLKNVEIPLPTCKKPPEGTKRSGIHLFQLLSILLSIVVMWAICAILTITNTFPNDPTSPRFRARTDAKNSLLSLSPWFAIPYPGQFGLPGFSLPVFIGFCAAFCSSMIESVGDYFAAAKACEVAAPPNHAVNRGIMVEGLGGFLGGSVGVGHATTSFSGNIAALSVSKTASRSVMICAGSFLIACAVIGKLGATMATIPDPILGGVLIITCGMLISIGLSMLRHVSLTSSRNLSILGIVLFIGIFIPEWLDRNREAVDTGYAHIDSVIMVVLGTPMFLGGIIAVVLDNTVKGTLEERGLLKWRHEVADDVSETGDNSSKVGIDEAFGWGCLPIIYRRLGFLQSLPFLPRIENAYREEKSGFIDDMPSGVV